MAATKYLIDIPAMPFFFSRHVFCGHICELGGRNRDRLLKFLLEDDLGSLIKLHRETGMPKI